MVMTKNITIHHSTAYDLLAGLGRLNFNEKMLEIKKEFDLEGKIKPNENILKMIENARSKMTKELSNSLDLFFNYESFFAMCLTSAIADNDLKNPGEFLDYLAKLPCSSILKRFVGTGFGENVTIENIEGMLKDHKTAIDFIEKGLSLPSKQKWELLQFFLDPEGMKVKLLQLLNWFNDKIYSEELATAEEVALRQEKELEKKFRLYGDDYFKLLVDVNHEKNRIEKPVVIAVSYYYEFSYLYSYVDDSETDFYMFGAIYPESIAERRHALLSSVNIFKALADETRLNIVKLLSERPWYGNELSQKLKLSNSTVSYHMSMLTMNGLVEAVREDNKFYFSLNMDKIKSTVCNALDKVIT